MQRMWQNIQRFVYNIFNLRDIIDLKVKTLILKTQHYDHELLLGLI